MGADQADSEVRRLEGEAGQWTPVSPDLLEVLTTALTVARGTGGAFDPTVGPLVALWREARARGKLPEATALDAARALVGWRHVEIDRARGMVRLTKPGMRLDLGGIARGYTMQEALRAVLTKGVGRALIECGGDIVAGNSPPGEAGWRVDVAAADEPFRRRARAFSNAAIATSGAAAPLVEIDGVRYSSIVDPRTGLGLTNHVVARVIARDAATADALATALAVTGPEGAAAILEKFPDALISLSVSAGR
jgi:thiamine biosynthesis lipoprotein